METSSLLQKLDKTPFPEFETEGVNLIYAREMLDNMGGIVSEMSAVALYFYNHLITHDQQEIAEIFEVISIEEMRHLEVFGELALDLGEDPKLLGVYRHAKYWWSPSYNKYPIRFKKRRPHRICLFVLFFKVLCAIQLDRKASLRAIKIGNIFS